MFDACFLGARAFLHATGDFGEKDAFQKPIVTISVPWSNALPCNYHFKDLAKIIAEEVERLGGKPFIHGTPVVADGEVQNTAGMKYSLVSRDLIADCIELMHDAYRADLLITIGGCDKSLPGTLMPLARGNHIGLTMYGGSASNGNLGCGQPTLPGMVAPADKLNAGSPYEAVGAYYAGDMDEDMVLAVEVP